jgi:dihydrolipoamide dehydrogenase
MPDIEGLDAIDAWTSREATATEELPRSVLIVGAGATGIELAQVFARYGVPTTLIASSARIFPLGHPRDSTALDATLRRDGVTIRTGARAVKARAGDSAEAHEIELADGSSARGHTIIVAVGRTPSVAGLGLETIDVDTSGGRLAVGDDLRVADGVFAAGDAAGRGMHSHLAAYEGRMAVRIALGDDVRPDYRAVPRAVYTDPEVAEVGLQLDEARRLGHDAFETSIDLADTAKGAAAEATGHVTIVADRKTRALLGAFIGGPGAAEAIHEPVLAIRMGATLEVLADTIHAFPTVARALGDLVADVANR